MLLTSMELPSKTACIRVGSQIVNVFYVLYVHVMLSYQNYSHLIVPQKSFAALSFIDPTLFWKYVYPKTVI